MFRVRITRVEEVEKVESEYEKLYDDAGFERVQAKDPEAKQYGYVTETVKKTEETEIYNQTVDDLNMKDVINAVNSLS